MSRAEEVLSFWFAAPMRTEQQIAARVRWWFDGGRAVDEEIRRKFGSLVEEAKSGALDDWGDTRARLALIIVLDQFARNLHRGTAAAYEHDHVARRLTLEGLAAGQYDELGIPEKLFFAMPLAHAEDMPAQRRAVGLTEKLYLDAPAPWKKTLLDSVAWARMHFDVVARFRRFPHRNAILGRTSTSEELSYLKFLQESGQML